MGSPLGTTGSNSAKEYRRVDNSFYKGTVVKNEDSPHLFRCKIYIPEIVNQPLADWLARWKTKGESKTLQLRFPGKNLSSGAWKDTGVWETIAEYLPWAEPCTSLIGEHGPQRFHSPTGRAVQSETNFPVGWPKTDSNTPTLQEGSFSPSYVYANSETNMGDTFTDTSPYLSMNNNPYGYNYGPKGYVDGPKGTFCQPRVGSQVWVFFYRGDHQFPVYFGGRQSVREIDPVYADAQGDQGNINPSLNYAGMFENDSPSNVASVEQVEQSGGSEGVVGDNVTDFVKNFEGFDPNAYSDYGQVSIGYGTRAKPGETTISQQEASRRLGEELSQARQEVLQVNSQQNRNWTENQIDALTSFTYNTGGGNLRTLTQSTRNNQQIADIMLQYNKAGGQVLGGLVTRRQAERELFLGGYST